MLSSTGVRWLREEFHWDQIEPAPGVWNWAHYDSVLASAAQRGMRVLPILMDSPSWVAASPLSIPADPATYATFVSQVAARYGPGGSFWRANAGLAAFAPPAFELWNEPWNATFAGGAVDPGRYGRLVRAAVSAARAANSQARFLLSADVGYSDIAGFHEWLTALYAAVPDLNSYFDGVAVHPYQYTGALDSRAPSELDGFRRIETLRDELVAHGASDKQLWLTEIGWSTCPQNVSQCVTEQQAGQLLSQLLGLLRTRYQSYVHAVFVYRFRDYAGDETDPTDRDSWFGLIRPDGTPKPELAVLQQQH